MEGLKKILNVTQLRNSDDYTIKNNNISSLRLMENAAYAFVNAFEKKELISKKIMILCGPGNNGGDGLAVCRLLRNKGFQVIPVLVKFKETLSKDCELNFKRTSDVMVLNSDDKIPDFSKIDIIIDAILGTGLHSPVKGFVARIIKVLNNTKKTIYSIDIPSGLLSDGVSKSKTIIQSDHIISFQRPKLSFFFPENSAFVKNWEVVDIGLSERFIQEQDSNQYILDKKIISLVQKRHKQSHKGTYGHSLLMVGSYGKIGAAILSAKACLRSGTGLLTTCVPKCGYEIIQISIPESMCLTDEHQDILTKMPDLGHCNSIGIGPGIGIDRLTVKLLKNILKSCVQPLVLDADAINIISAHQKLLKHLPKNTILTPHIKEFDRLVGKSKNTLERLKKQQDFSIKHNCIIVLKDAFTCITSTKGAQYFNTSGNQGMATGGSGDVLTGIVTGLLAQNYPPLRAALIAVYFHGVAGDKAAKHKGFQALIASDIIDHLMIEPANI